MACVHIEWNICTYNHTCKGTCVHITTHTCYSACILQTKLAGWLELKTNPILASVWRGDTILNNYFPHCVPMHAGKPPPELRLSVYAYDMYRAVCENYSPVNTIIYTENELGNYSHTRKYSNVYTLSFSTLCTRDVPDRHSNQLFPKYNQPITSKFSIYL